MKMTIALCLFLGSVACPLFSSESAMPEQSAADICKIIVQELIPSDNNLEQADTIIRDIAQKIAVDAPFETLMPERKVYSISLLFIRILCKKSQSTELSDETRLTLLRRAKRLWEIVKERQVLPLQ